LALKDAQGRQSGPLSLLAALVLTYCDGEHEPGTIADAVASSIATADRPATDQAAIKAQVQRALDGFASEGMLD
jgi:hypothetical protein